MLCKPISVAVVIEYSNVWKGASKEGKRTSWGVCSPSQKSSTFEQVVCRSPKYYFYNMFCYKKLHCFFNICVFFQQNICFVTQKMWNRIERWKVRITREDRYVARSRDREQEEIQFSGEHKKFSVHIFFNENVCTYIVSLTKLPKTYVKLTFLPFTFCFLDNVLVFRKEDLTKAQEVIKQLQKERNEKVRFYHCFSSFLVFFCLSYKKCFCCQNVCANIFVRLGNCSEARRSRCHRRKMNILPYDKTKNVIVT